MHATPTTRRQWLRTLALAAPLLAVTAPRALAQDQPDPVAILEGARMAVTLAELDDGLTGNLVRGRTTVPVALFLRGEDIQFQVAEDQQNWKAFHLRLRDDNFNLFEIIDGRQTNFPPRRLVEPIAGTDLTYEDLSFRFFYWPNPRYEGTENVGGHSCHRLRLDKPAGEAGRYEAVYVWVHARFGAFMRVRGHDAAGGLIKEFQVQDVMQVGDDVWTLRRMQVATHDPSNGRRISITDVVFDTPRRARPRGLR